MAVGVGALAVGPHLRFLLPSGSSDDGAARAATATPTKQTFRTGHSNNCDGACGHLIEVADGHPVMVKAAPWEDTTIAGTAAQKFNPRVCLRGLSQPPDVVAAASVHDRSCAAAE